MPTLLQLRANLANARHSTGAKTAEGKSISSKNATKHGLTAQNAVTPLEDATEFKTLVTAMFDHYQPQDIHQELLVRSMASAQWRLRLPNASRPA